MKHFNMQMIVYATFIHIYFQDEIYFNTFSRSSKLSKARIIDTTWIDEDWIGVEEFFAYIDLVFEPKI